MNEIFSAQIVLQPDVDISDSQRIRNMLTDIGFGVGPEVGGNFSVTAPVTLFEQVFGVELRRDQRGDYEVLLPSGKSADEAGQLPVDQLPSELKGRIVAVVFTRRPDFGP